MKVPPVLSFLPSLAVWRQRSRSSSFTGFTGQDNFKAASVPIVCVALVLKHHSYQRTVFSAGESCSCWLCHFGKHILRTECHTSRLQCWYCCREALLILPSRVSKASTHFTVLLFTSHVTSSLWFWAHKLQTLMVSGTLICNLPTRDDPEGPEETFLEPYISSMSCNLVHL